MFGGVDTQKLLVRRLPAAGLRVKGSGFRVEEKLLIRRLPAVGKREGQGWGRSGMREIQWGRAASPRFRGGRPGPWDALKLVELPLYGGAVDGEPVILLSRRTVFWTIATLNKGQSRRSH